jgi:hypothetical protein
MTRYYADENKRFWYLKQPIFRYRTDKLGDQQVNIDDTVFGTVIRPTRRWTPFCEKLFHQFKANTVRLEEMSWAPDGKLNFINDLPACKSLIIEGEKPIDLSPLAGNPHLEDLQVSPWARVAEFDLTTLPNLRRCFIPLRPPLMSFLNCPDLVCLHLCCGAFEGILNLESLPALEEFMCSNMPRLKGVKLNPKVRLRSLDLADLKSFETIEPLRSVVERLLVVELHKTPRLNPEWLAQARRAECISLGLRIPSINFLKGLKKLQVLSLFHGKVADQDFRVRDALKGELDHQLYSDK